MIQALNSSPQCNAGTSDRLAVSDKWVLRRDPGFHTPYLAYDIETGRKLKLTQMAYVILSLLDLNSIAPQSLAGFLVERGCGVSNSEVDIFVAQCLAEGLLTQRTASPPHRSIAEVTEQRWNVPVTSFPYEVEIHLTNSCNLKCRHCFYDSGRKIPGQLNGQEWRKLIEELEAMRTLRIILSGGEPLTHPNAQSVLESLSRARMRVDLLTNGTKLTEPIADILASRRFSTSISLDGADEQTHDKLRGLGSFGKVMRGIHLLKEKKAVFHLSTTVHQQNIEQMRMLCELGVEAHAASINFILLDPLGRAKSANDLWLEPSQRETIGDAVCSLRATYAGAINIGFLDPSLPTYDDLPAANEGGPIYCTAGTTRIAIRSDGYVYPCAYGFADKKFAIGSIREVPIAELWRSSKFDVFRGAIRLKDLRACGACSLANLCTAKLCRLRSHYENGDFFGRPPSCPAAAR